MTRTERKTRSSTARVEGLLEGLREVFTGRRATLAEAVGEDPEGYDPR